MQQQPTFQSTRAQRAAAVMQASVYQAVAIGAATSEAIIQVLSAAWSDRRVELTRETVDAALRRLRTAGLVVDSIQGLNAIAGPRLAVDYDRGVALPEAKS